MAQRSICLRIRQMCAGATIGSRMEISHYRGMQMNVRTYELVWRLDLVIMLILFYCACVLRSYAQCVFICINMFHIFTFILLFEIHSIFWKQGDFYLSFMLITCECVAIPFKFHKVKELIFL